MNTYYDIRLTPEQRNALILASQYTKETAECEPFIFSEEELKLVEPMKQAYKLLETAEEHPNIEDVYQYEAEHSGFTDGEKVLLECTIISSADRVSTVAVHHLPTSPGAVIMVSNNLIYHKD